MNSDLPGESTGITCAWCGKVIHPGREGVAVSHGICALCAGVSGMFPIENLATATAAALDRLPFGVIRLRTDGNIDAYSAAEESLSGRTRDEVIGRNFFRDVAPCTGVAAFEGQVARLREGTGGGRTTFAFVFQFPGGQVLVSISAAHDIPSDTVTLLVKATA